MNINELSEKDFKKVKEQLIEKGNLVKQNSVKNYEAMFSEVVTLSSVVLKFFIFFSLALYLVFNVFGIVLAVKYNTIKGNLIEIVIGLLVVTFITIAIFTNINTNKKKKNYVLYVKDGNFIFNFYDAVVVSQFYYILPYESIKQIDFLIYGAKKENLFGKITLVFSVLNYEVVHIIPYTNLTKIKDFLKRQYPSLTDKINIDNKKNSYYDKINKAEQVRNNIFLMACFLLSVMLVCVPLMFNYFNLSLIIAAVILFITSLIMFISKYIYTNLEKGVLISSVFIIFGYCLPLFFIFNSKLTFLHFISQNVEVLMPTILGNIGVCLYLYIICITISKICFKLKYKNKNIDI